MQLTVNVSEELGRKLKPLKSQIPRALESFVEEQSRSADPWRAEAVEILKKLMSRPSREEILVIRPSKGFQKRISQLLAKNKVERLSGDEKEEMERFLYLEEVVQLAKARAVYPNNGHETE